MKWYDIRFWKWACIGLVVGVILLAFTGCKTKEYVKVPEYHTEYIVRSDTIAKMDSVYVKDSVYVYHKGDTVVISKIAYRDRYRNIYKVKLDTIIKRDSIEGSCAMRADAYQERAEINDAGKMLYRISFPVGCMCHRLCLLVSQ